jgi:hypothetical protein
VCRVLACLTMKPVGELDAGTRHVQFDERGWETGRCRMATATAPILDSTLRGHQYRLHSVAQSSISLPQGSLGKTTAVHHGQLLV